MINLAKGSPCSTPSAHTKVNIVSQKCVPYNNSPGAMNPGDDSDPNHWDIALLVSGVDFWTPKGRPDQKYITMGLSTVGGVCLYPKTFDCVIGESGVSLKGGLG